MTNEKRTATSRAYRYRTPRFSRRGRFPDSSHSLRLVSISCSSASHSRFLAAASMRILSPSFKSAIGPPTWASGVIYKRKKSDADAPNILNGVQVCLQGLTHMPDNKPSRCTAEPSICDQSNSLPKASSHYCTRWT